MTEESPAAQAARRRRAQGTAIDFDGGRLDLARRLARQSRAGLARTVGVTPTAVTQFERGSANPTAPVLAQLALALGVPRDFFRHGRPVTTIPADSAHFRSLRATSAVSREQALAFAELALEVVDVIEQYVDLPPVDLPDLDVLPHPTPRDVAAAAAASRELLGVAPGPVGNVVRLLEAHGVVVLRLPANVDRAVDAFSVRPAGRPMVLLSPVKDDKARSRFDTAHELGHLVLHHDGDPGNKMIEAQAHSFAAEFLMPAEEIVDDLPRRVDWERLHAAKRRWGTSLKSLVYRAHTLGLMTDASYQRANRDLARAGNPEAGPLGPPESPTLLGAAIALLADNGTSLEALADGARLFFAQAEEVVLAGSDTRPRVHLRVD